MLLNERRKRGSTSKYSVILVADRQRLKDFLNEEETRILKNNIRCRSLRRHVSRQRQRFASTSRSEKNHSQPYQGMARR